MDQAKLNAFLGTVVGDFGAAVSVVLAHIGDKLGLYKAMADGAPVNSEELAEKTGLSERYIREWLINQAAGGYVEFDAETRRYRLPEEQAMALADEMGPAFVGGGFQLLTALMKSEARITEAFRTGGGMLWGEHDSALFAGTERFFRPGYVANLVPNWIPALDGVQEKLERGGKVADIGCGHGASTILMAQGFPNSRFWGFDNHAPSIDAARKRAEEAGVADRVTFEVADSTKFPGENYDMVAFFDCFHDLGDPEGAARHASHSLAKGGIALIVEPMAGRTVEENFNPVGRVYSGASVLCCTPNAIASGGPALGTVATDDAICAVVQAGGFSHFRRATETPFNRVFEAKVAA